MVVKINHTFLLISDCRQTIGQSHCKVMSVENIRDKYHTFRLNPDSPKYYAITSCSGSATYFYLRLGIGLSKPPPYGNSSLTKCLKYPK